MSQNKTIPQLDELGASDASSSSNRLLAWFASGVSGRKSRWIGFSTLFGALARLFGYYFATDPRFGASTNNTGADNLTAIQACMDAAPAGSVIIFPPSTTAYTIAGTLSVTKAVTFWMYGATLTQATANTGLFSGTAVDNCHWRGGTLAGPQFAVQRANENAIKIVGTSAASPATNITIRDCFFQSWGMQGVYLQYVEDFDVSHNRFRDIWYGAIMTASAIGGTVHRNRIRNVVGTPNAYGIAFSRLSTPSLVTDPPSEDITCTGNVVRDVTNWEGLDTHAGKGIVFSGNRVRGCSTGIAIVASTNGSGTDLGAPQDITVSGNTIDSKSTTGAATYGIAFTGAQGTTGSPIELATGTITGNTVRGHGSQSVSTSGAIYCHDTSGLTISGNTIIEPSPHGIFLTNDNYDFAITGNTIRDQWSTSYSFPGAIVVGTNYNTGIISGNRNGTGSKVATNVRVWGIRVGSGLTNSAVILGENSMEAAATPYSIATAAAVVSGTRASPLTLGASGTALSQIVVYTPSITPASVGAATVAEQTFTVTGLTTTDKVIVSPPNIANATGIAGARVSASNTLAIRFVNPTAGALTPTSGTYTVIAIRS